MGSVNDRYKNEIEHSILFNGDPLDNCEIIDERLVIKPQSYSKPEISDSDKAIILQELSEDLKHYGLEVIHLDDKLIRVSSGDFELDVPKSLVIPYDDDIFASILKHQQQHFMSRCR